MTIREVITRLDALKHNIYTDAEKLQWLSTIEGRIRAQIIDTHEGGPDTPFIPFTQNTPMDTVLLAPAPWDEVYLRFLEAQIDVSNGEIEKYNNSNALFQSAWEAYWRFYHCSHMPKAQSWKFP